MSLIKSSPVAVSDEKLMLLLAAAQRAADAAADVTLRYFRSDMNVVNKAGEHAFDPVTEADRLAELAIRASLKVDFPDIGFHGEEHAAIAGGSGLTWVVDPIDGTRAFMSGMPLWGTLIGLFNGRDAILGLMDQPFMAERYTAIGSQANLLARDGLHSLQTRKNVTLEQATMYCTTPDMFDTAESKAAFQRVRETARLTRYGGDCYAYAMLAAGHVDVVLDCDLKPYDILALIPLIEAAGGVVSNWEGNSAVDGGYVVAAGSRQLHAQALSLLQIT
ncbi:histidinol-phosphatase [Granulosicoccus antarcticus]|uniref:Histidinol-phosphatase n=1 Tax=Granulosicoccus antarcticus IMCC3135 TaxID=1192854 RepID=A0A2Z2P702_9GAMM|nr:histidinol-phosphatase [Granulosicoccus antarcticus]ASJ75634.1 Histidinol-phosphatase [Granulosicoccus antarcticus IMCC3135]